MGDLARPAERGEQSGDELCGRLVHPGDRRPGLPRHHWNPEEKEERSGKDGERGARPLLGGGDGDGGSHREEREVVRVEERRREERDCRQPAGSLPGVGREEEEREDQNRQ